MGVERATAGYPFVGPSRQELAPRQWRRWTVGGPACDSGRLSDISGWAPARAVASRLPRVGSAPRTPMRDATGGRPAFAAMKRQRASAFQTPPKDDLAARPGGTSLGACRRPPRRARRARLRAVARPAHRERGAASRGKRPVTWGASPLPPASPAPRRGQRQRRAAATAGAAPLSWTPSPPHRRSDGFRRRAAAWLGAARAHAAPSRGQRGDRPTGAAACVPRRRAGGRALDEGAAAPRRSGGGGADPLCDRR